MFNMRIFLFSAIAIAIWVTLPAAAQNDPSGDSLRSLANRLDMQYGAWHFHDHFENESISRQIDEREFEIMSFGAFGPDKQTAEGVWNYGKVNEAIDRVNTWSGDRSIMGIYLSGPNAYLPDWWKGSESDDGYKNASGAVHSELLETHINEVVGRYADRVDKWGVVNEALRAAPDGSAYNEQGRWTHTNNQLLNKADYDGYRGWEPMTWQGEAIRDASGNALTMPVFIRQAFEQTRAIDPTAKLYYNDVANAALGERHTEIQYDLVRALLDKGVSIDAVGMQMHLNVDSADGLIRNNKGDIFDIDGFVANVQRYRDLNVEVYLTELDVRVPTNASSTDFQKQKQAYYQVVNAAARSGAVNSILQWGPDDSIAWMNERMPTIFSGADNERNAKPAYFGVQEGLYDALTERVGGRQAIVKASAGNTQIMQLNSGGNLTYSMSTSRARVGRQGNNNSAVFVIPFLLPELGEGETISLARLDIFTDQVDSSSGTGVRPNIDLYALGARGTDQVTIDDYFAGDGTPPPGDVLISASFVGGEKPYPDSTSPFENQYWTLGETSDLAAYLSSLYAAGAVGGEDYVFFRLNMDEAGYDSSRFALIDSNGDPLVRPSLTFFINEASVPEPTSIALMGIVTAALLTRRR